MSDPRPLTPQTVTRGRGAFLSLLASEGVEVMFGNPGTTELAIMEALAHQSQIEYVLGLQESLVVALADGYARASNRLAACNSCSCAYLLSAYAVSGRNGWLSSIGA